MTTISTEPKRPKVTVIDPAEPEKAKLRVAAYARVSSDSEDQLNSYIAQVDFYTQSISANEEWELVDIYADEGISGLETRKRDDFNRLMADCRAGKIDRVLCKSISRFARNTKEYLQFVRELLRLGISIHFEKENIDTGRMTSEQIATIYGAFAQMESQNHSSNMRISVRMRMEKGLFVPSSVPYGYRLAGAELEIVPNEAAVVRQIFDAYLSGRGKDDIAKELSTSGSGECGREKWYPSTISYILTNPSYTGDMVWQKSFHTDTIPFRKVQNKGQKPQYFAQGCHPPIIDREDFERVQELMTSRREQFVGEARPITSVYSKHVFCGGCGSICRKKVVNGRDYWVCRRHDQGKELCPVPPVPESELSAAALRLCWKLKKGQNSILRPMLGQLRELRDRELSANRRFHEIDKEVAHLAEQNHVLSRLKSKGYVDSALYCSQMDEMNRKLRELRKLRRRVLETAGEDQQLRATEMMLDFLEEQAEWEDAVKPELFESLLERILLLPDEKVKLRFQNGLEVTEAVERAVR